jgi:hypothetical protein
MKKLIFTLALLFTAMLSGASTNDCFTKPSQSSSPELYGYYWVLHNDGCWYLGAVYVDDAGDVWWYPCNTSQQTTDNQFGYHGVTSFCMDELAFDSFC